MRVIWFCFVIVSMAWTGDLSLHHSRAQSTVEEVLEQAGPQWESQRKRHYNQTGIRIEQLEERQAPGAVGVRRTRQSRDFFSSGDAKMIRKVGLTPETTIDESAGSWDSDAILWSNVIAQNSKYGFKVEYNQTHQLWGIKQQTVWGTAPTWKWLVDPLPTVSPVDQALMRGLSLDPRLGVSSSDLPLELLFTQMSDQKLTGKVNSRVDSEGRRVVEVNWTNFVDELDPTSAPQGAVGYQMSIRVDLLPDQEWQLQYYEMRIDFIDNNQQSIVVHRWTSEFDYSQLGLNGSYRITDIEDAGRGFIKTIRFIRRLRESEQSSLLKLCFMSGYQLPEPEGLPQDSRWWLYLLAATAGGILLWFGRRLYRSR